MTKKVEDFFLNFVAFSEYLNFTFSLFAELIVHYNQRSKEQCPGSDWDNCNQLLGVTYSKIGGSEDDHQVVVKITEMTVPLSPPRRDSLIVIFYIFEFADSVKPRTSSLFSSQRPVVRQKFQPSAHLSTYHSTSLPYQTATRLYDSATERMQMSQA